MVFILQKTLIFAIPLLIVALAGMFAERSGIINIALDGIMIFGAFIGAVIALNARQASTTFVEHPQLLFILCMLIAAIAGGLFSLLLSVSAIKFNANQTIGGTALNLLAQAISLFLIKVFTTKDQLEMGTARNSDGKVVDFTYVIKNNDLPPALQVFFDKTYISTFVCIILFIILSIFIYKTKTGLRLRACGENPHAADSVGINVYKMRYLGTTISGALAGLGGYVYIATVANGTASGAVAGMGFLALAIMIFGNWKPLGIALGALMFGFLKCLSVVYSQFAFTKNLGLPMYFYNIIPYVAVLIVLAFSAGKSRAPKAAGIPAVALNRDVYADPEAADWRIVDEMRAEGAEYLVMAGYMRMVHAPILRTFENRVVNLHPALLPSFKGAHAIQDAFDYGVKVTGVTVHFADDKYDCGPIIAQRALPVREDWDVDTLEAHIHEIEHELYPDTIQLLAEGRVHVEGNKVVVDPPAGA